jgi:hypothetical protein
MNRAARYFSLIAFTFLMAHGLNAAQSTSTNASKPADQNVTASLDSSSATPLLASSSNPSAATGRNGSSDRSYPKIEWAAEYSFWRAMPTSRTNRMGYLHGGSTSVAYNFNSFLGIVGDFAGFDNSRLTLFTPTTSQTVNSSGSAFTYLFGPRVTFRSSHERFTPYIQILFGGITASAVTISGCGSLPICTPLGSQTAFTEAFGAGIDIKITHNIAWRAFEGNYILTRFNNSATGNPLIPGYQRNVRFSSGLVYRFGM